jgi:hypothetical protein
VEKKAVQIIPAKNVKPSNEVEENICYIIGLPKDYK